VQLRDLAIELVRQGHQVTVLVASSDLQAPWRIEDFRGVRVVRLRSPRTRDMSFVRRTLGEVMLPFAMLWRLRRSPVWPERWDGVAWYSPTIFLGLVARVLGSRSRCRTYLIVRDIFPDWAVDMGLMGRGLPYLFFRQVARYQYSVADTIGIQTPGNETYFQEWRRNSAGRLEVLHNWLAPPAVRDCSISLGQSSLAGRSIFVYAGNMGVAQGTGVLLELADLLRDRADAGFIFVGRGSAVAALKEEARRRALDNVLFFDEIDPDEIPGLYAQCSFGMLSLDPRHRTHNIPGKFISYMHAGLPVLASVNAGNDIVALIRREAVGEVVTDGSAVSLAAAAVRLLDDAEAVASRRERCRALAKTCFSVQGAAQQLVAALAGTQGP
jgi:glycosyltransferase involved in cell wall biosynthesis